MQLSAEQAKTMATGKWSIFRHGGRSTDKWREVCSEPKSQRAAEIWQECLRVLKPGGAFVAKVFRGGTENVDVAFATGRGITVMNTPGRNARAVADAVPGNT